MGSPIIKVDNLSKQYHIGTRERINRTFREAVVDAISSPVRNFRNLKRLTKVEDDKQDTIWALKDISFEVQPGEVIGIIGRNGAGKSTLLKILSRITEPTHGEIRLHGRVSSLLEIGTGFHPELTGRENIYLNGTILGMRKAEIDRKFDEIVAFSEIEKFLDTPVKRYSSGMYVRLAFAVAAHLEPEILLVDEVLAVGDAEFQKKCLGKMDDVAQAGRTILFVSHNMQAIRQLCQRGFVLENGMLPFQGSTIQAVDKYVGGTSPVSDLSTITRALDRHPVDPVIRITNIEILQNGEKIQTIQNGKEINIKIEYDVFQKTRGLRIYFDLCDMSETLLFRSFHDEDRDGIPTMEPGKYISEAVIPSDFLGPITYKLIIRAGIHNVRSCLSPEGIVVFLNVEKTGTYNRAYVTDTFRGRLAPHIRWITKEKNDEIH